jgi:phosphatidylserine decarboxylase
LSGNDFIASTSVPLYDITSKAPKADPETGLYELREPPDPATMPKKGRFKISLSRSSSSQSLNKLARPGLTTRHSSSMLHQIQHDTGSQLAPVTSNPMQSRDPNAPPSPGDHGNGFDDHGDPDLHEFIIPLQLKNKEKWEEKHSPELFIKAKYLPYPALRQQFWRAMLKQYDTDESGCISRIELTTMLDTLGSTLKESTIDSFFQRFPHRTSGEETWELSKDEAVICLEDQLHVKNKQAVTDKVKDMFPDLTTMKNLIPPILGGGETETLSSSSTSMAPTGSSTPSETTTPLLNEQKPLGLDTQDVDDLGAAGEEGEYLDRDDLNDRGEEHVVEIKECPICHQPRLHKRSDADIITHIATCASQDWRQVNNIVMAGFVTSSQAQRKWYSKVITKISYGGYKLGANSANILVQDRITGQINEERMSIYVRLGIRLLYKGFKSREMEKKRSMCCCNIIVFARV